MECLALWQNCLSLKTRRESDGLSKYVLSVTQLNTYVKSILDADAVAANVFVSGEISNLSGHYASGHLYFSLKDEESIIKAVMFRAAASRLKFKPESGMKVLCRGRVSLFERDGQYQLYIEDMQPQGVGALSVAFEQLKEKLRKEGLFDEAYKKPLPLYPETAAVITSESGAVVKDICQIMTRRYPLCKLIICPVQVQGERAAEQMTEMLRKVNEKELADVIIIGRGGGSAEDLWAFNDERLVRTIHASKIPVISAVGHETDYTLCDFAADLRAPTPSAAAELCVPDGDALASQLLSLQRRISVAFKQGLDEKSGRIKALLALRCLGDPGYYRERRLERLELAVRELRHGYENILNMNKARYKNTLSVLESLNPFGVLRRGYAAVSKNGEQIFSVSKLHAGDFVSLRLADGVAECNITGTSKE
ncbi:MAG TPA: exodeoxyribonuclease VII large subunit [Ruminococcaceae bacterium]|nr:exodeoxyribonuclease VII large subunit [Oscillospiraceae bacterium]